MIDRRPLAVLVIVAAGVLVGRIVLSEPPDRPAEPEVIAAQTLTASATSRPLATDSAPPGSAENVTVTEAAERAQAPPTAAIDSVDVVDVVEARRPTIDRIQTEHDLHPDDGEQIATGGGNATTVGQVAAELIVVTWTWRFDDSNSRHRDALASLADGETIDALLAAPEERQRRIDAGEVSWVIIRDVSVDDSRAMIRFDQHLLTTLSTEVVTARFAVVTVVAGLAVDVEVVS